MGKVKVHLEIRPHHPEARPVQDVAALLGIIQVAGVAAGLLLLPLKPYLVYIIGIQLFICLRYDCLVFRKQV